MNILPARWQHWLRQKALEGTAGYLSKQGQWGFTEATLSYLGDFIASSLADHYAATDLKSAVGAVHTHTIDELVYDLSVIQRTIERGDYVDERLVYLNPSRRSLHQYLARRDGSALTPVTAWSTFHNKAYQVAQSLDLLLTNDVDETDRDYYRRRYGSVFQEVMEIYRLYLRLIDYTLPNFPVST